MKSLIAALLFPVLILAQDHLLMTEIKIPSSTETNQAFVEIYNPAPTIRSLNEVYLANYNTYYTMVNGVYSNIAGHFIVKFPDINIGAKETMVVALRGQTYYEAFGKRADLEIFSSDDATPDMIKLRVGDNPVFEFTRGMAVLFSWNGSADLVEDIDYFPWGIIAFNSFWMDKSGVQIDGPDAGAEESAYKPDLTKSQQKAWTAPTNGSSLQRISITETDEVKTGGNGIGGHNEATENWKISFAPLSPTPGSFSENPGDGTGTVAVEPDSVNAQSTTNLTFTITGTADYTLTGVEISIPAGWQWTQTANDVSLSGTGFTNASVSVNGNVITLSACELTESQTGTVALNNIESPGSGGVYGFPVKTAISGGTLTGIGQFPRVTVVEPLSIAEIQNNFSEYNGKTVTINGVVAIGAGITRKDHTDAYVQDASGRGINAFFYDQILADLVRGNRVQITGKISEYQSTTQIGDFTVEVLSENNDIPGVEFVSTIAATDVSKEGTMIETAGVIIDLATGIGGGTNITINDGSGNLQLRIWDVSGVNVSAYAIGDTLGVRGIIDSYLGNAQLLVAYQDDVFPGVIPERADGSGKVTVSPDSVGKAENTELTFTVTGTVQDTLGQLSLNIPSYWQWSSSSGDVSTTGSLSGASVSVSNKRVTLSNFDLLKNQTGALIISNLITPGPDTISVFTVRTAKAGGTLTNIKSMPRVTVGKGTNIETISIKDARKFPKDSLVTVKGIVTIGIGILRTTWTDAYIQDESGYGINIYNGGMLDPNFKRGNLVIVKGIIDIFNGKIEIKNYTATLLQEDAVLPKIQEITTGEAATTLYEGSYVQIRGAITGRTYSGGGTSIYVDDGSGECTVRAWDTAKLNLNDFLVNEFVIIRGVVGLYSGAGQILLGYQDDIAKPTFDGTPVFMKVENKPFVPDRGEKIDIRFSAGAENATVTLRIFDMSGRLVVTLLDGAALPFVLTKQWDGRNHLNEQVPLGAYICHMEIVNKDTGKRTEKVAPIVVGTVLK